MRELKFRAWDGNKMLYSEYGQFYLVPLGVQVSSSTGHEFYDKDYPVMQYTGLKDKNGSEIYEGDIISYPYVTPFGQLTDEEDTDLRTHVVFGYGEFSLKYPHHTESLKSCCKRHQGEYIPNYGNKTIYENETLLTVIGNIHENPELLNQ